MNERGENRIAYTLLGEYSEDDLLKQVLSACVPVGLVEKLSYRILRRFGSLEALFNLSSYEKAELDEISPKILIQLKLLHRYHLIMLKKTVFTADLFKNPELCADYLRAKLSQPSGVSQAFIYLDDQGIACREEYYKISRGSKVQFSRNRITSNALKFQAENILLGIGLFANKQELDAESIETIKGIKNDLAIFGCGIAALLLFTKDHWRIIDV